MYLGWEEAYNESDGNELWGQAPSPILEQTREKSTFKPGSLLGEFGAGDGRNALPLLADGMDLICVDISRTGLRKIAEKVEKQALRRPVLINAPLEDLPLVDEQLDGAICIDVLPQIRHPRRALEEIHRTLRTGGKLVVNLFTPEDAAFGEGEVIGPRTFMFKNTLFAFYDREDCDRLFEGLFNVEDATLFTWEDGPHMPFRPYSHIHSAWVYTLTK